MSIDYILRVSDIRNETVQLRNLKENEQILIQTYQKLDLSGKERAQAYMECYLAVMKDKAMQKDALHIDCKASFSLFIWFVSP